MTKQDQMKKIKKLKAVLETLKSIKTIPKWGSNKWHNSYIGIEFIPKDHYTIHHDSGLIYNFMKIQRGLVLTQGPNVGKIITGNNTWSDNSKLFYEADGHEYKGYKVEVVIFESLYDLHLWIAEAYKPE